MPRSKTPKKRIEIVLFNGKPTIAGHIYPQDALERIVQDIAVGKGPVLEEIDPIARELAKKSELDVWKERVMADSVDCRLEDGILYVTFEIRNNKYGKRFQTALDTNGIRGLHFYPVGYGTPDTNGVIRDYCLSYVSFTPRNAIKI